MNLQERESLNRFLEQLSQAQVGPKDGEAEQLIRATCSRQPDAAYLLIQRALLLEQALQASQARVASLEGELSRTRTGGGFLSANAWGNAPAAAASPAAAPVAAGRGSGLLGTIATTAAGVVAGSFLFQGIEHLLGHDGGSGAGEPHRAEALAHGDRSLENSLLGPPADVPGDGFFSDDSLIAGGDVDSSGDWV